MYNYNYGIGKCDGVYTDLALERRRADLNESGVEYTKELCPPGTWERVRITSDAGAKKHRQAAWNIRHSDTAEARRG